jgi:RNA polymerase sigma factor (sigma-70 family)
MIDHEAERSEHMRRLHTVLSALEPRERTVLYLVDGQGYTVTAAAGIMGVARETAARARSSARRKLALID